MNEVNLERGDLEPAAEQLLVGCSFSHEEGFIISVAISLKRIADVLEKANRAASMGVS